MKENTKNETVTNQSSNQISELIQELNKSNTFNFLLNLFEKKVHLAMWAIILLVGGVFLALHFVYIRNFPEVEFVSSVALLAIISITSILLMMLFSSMFLTTNFFWNFFLKSKEGEEVVSYLEIQGNKCIEVGYLFFLPSFLGLAITAYAATNIASFSDEGIIYLCVLPVIASPLFGVFLYNFLNYFGRLPRASIKANFKFAVVLALGTASFLVTPILIFVFSFSVFTPEYSKPQTLGDLINGVFFVSAICLLFSSALLVNQASAKLTSSKPAKTILQYIGTGLFILFFCYNFNKQLVYDPTIYIEDLRTS